MKARHAAELPAARCPHTVAVVADVSFGVGIVAAAATAWLYLSRPKASAPATPATGKASANLSITPAAARSGGGLLVGGAF